MSRDPIRNYVLAMYPNRPGWAKRVEAMSRDQVFAIYKSDLEKKEQQQQQKSEPEDQYPQGKLF
jgi:hypothetical protein